MAFIKSAFELAMEKTEGLTVDKDELHRKEIHNAGRTGSVQALTGDDGALEALAKTQEKTLSKTDFAAWCQGAAETLLSRVNFNADTGAASELNKVFSLLDELARRKAGPRLQKMSQLLTQYQQELRQLKDAIAQQIGPAIRQRAQQLAQQTGASAQFILEKDPTYLKVLNENLDPMKAEYSQALEQLKEDYRRSL